MTTRLASSRLIGRTAELAELEAALADAADGRASLAFVAGESGVGKTRLLAELERRARDAGTLALVGEAVDLGGESELPYLPLVAALRPLARHGDPALTPPVREAVAPLLPGLGETPADPGSQGRLFEGLLSLLDALGQQRPVLLVIEDLHWADGSTRAALAFLSRSLTDERVLVVGSYRADELHPGHPLRPLRAEIERDPRVRRIALEPLTRAELAELLEDVLGAPPAPDLLDRLWERSGGNPLFGEELLSAGLEGPAPDTLREALMLRVERLSETAQALLSVVAVGERLDQALLEQASGLEARTLRDALHEAVERSVLVAQDDGMYRFRHALAREVVEDRLLPGERSDLHLAIARGLEQRLEADPGAQIAAAVAHHFAAAGDRPAALTSAVRAATAAERVHAHAEVAALLGRALELWDRVPDAEARAGADRAAVLLRAAEAAGALGDPDRQLALLETALAELGPEPDPARAARVLESTARAQRHLNRAGDSIATLERALELGGGDPPVRANLLAAFGRALMLVGRFADAARSAREALPLAAEADLPQVEGHARNTLGYSIAMTGAIDEGAAELQEAIRIAREHGGPLDLATASVNAADILHMAGRSAEGRAIAREGRRAVEGRDSAAIVWLDLKLAELAFDLGEWDEAEALLPAGSSAAQSRLGILLRRAALAAGRGDHEAAAALLAELEPLGEASSEPQAVAPLAVLVAEVRRGEGDLAAARAAVDRALERVGDAVHAAVVAAMGVTVEADDAERARDLGDEAAQEDARRRVDALLERVTAAATPARPVEHALLLGATAEAARAADRPDPEACSRAAAAWEDLGRAEPAARMRWREAEALMAAGDRDAAADAARTAHAAAAELGAGRLLADVERLAARARLPLEPVAAPDEPEEEDAFGLTAREREVLALLAEGATNREIGATLFMAEKTASVHVSRILVKLNARTRTEAAAVAHRHGLAKPG